jgi:hypothetical protein
LQTWVHFESWRCCLVPSLQMSLCIDEREDNFGFRGYSQSAAQISSASVEDFLANFCLWLDEKNEPLPRIPFHVDAEGGIRVIVDFQFIRIVYSQDESKRLFCSSIWDNGWILSGHWLSICWRHEWRGRGAFPSLNKSGRDSLLWWLLM